MNRQTATQAHQQRPTATPSAGGLLQRKCACGNHTIAGGECSECGKKRRWDLQTKLSVNEPGDLYEREADRIADQVLTTPAHQAGSSATSRIQRFSGQPTGQMDTAPAGVDQALASPGRPLEPELRQDMEQRFGYDFSRVTVHTGAVAEQSARDVNAHAYTVGSSIVFGAGRFAPVTSEGWRLLAHELTHVVQQSGADRLRVRQSKKKCSPSLSADYSIARKPRTSATDAPPAVVKTMARDEARAALGAYIGRGGMDDTFAALSAIQDTLAMPFTVENARLRLRLLTAAFSLLDRSSAANLLKALTTPVGAGQKHLSERFGRLDRRFRASLLDILRERATAKAAPEPEQAGKPAAAAAHTAKPTWIELHPGVVALVPDPGTTLNAVAAYVSENPDIPPALARLNKLSRTAPIEAGQSIIVPVEFIQRPKAFQEMSEPMRRYIASTQEAEAQHAAWRRFAQVRTPNLPGPGIGGSMLLAAKLTREAIERIVDAWIDLFEKAAYAIASAAGKAAYAIAFAAGVVHGFLKSIWDAVSGIAKLIYDVLKSILSLDIVSDLGDLVGSLKNLSLDRIKEMLGEWAADWAKKLLSGNPLIAGHAHGYLTGYVMAEAAMLLLTGGAAEEAKAALWASDLGKLVKGSRAFKTLGTVVEQASKVRRAVDVGGEFEKAVDALRKSRLGKVVKAAEVTGAAVVWTAQGVSTALSLPGRMLAHLTDEVIGRVKQLYDLFPRIKALSDRAKWWLFGCRSPCRVDVKKIRKTLQNLTDDEIEAAVELIDPKTLEPKKGAHGVLEAKAGAIQLDLPDIVKVAMARLKAAGVKGLSPAKYGTRLHAEVSAVLTETLGEIPKGWVVGSETRLSSLVKLDPATAKMTVRQYMTKSGMAKRYSALPDKFLDTPIGGLTPDVYVRAPDGRILVWDLTSEEAAAHVAKSMVYAELIGRETGGFLRIAEDYWRKVVP